MKIDKKTLDKCKIFSMLSGAKEHISFHTPGHKYGKWDITELSFSDNLSSPTGVLKEAESDIARELNAYESFISTDGSTMGVLSMIYASGAKKLVFPRNSHKSVYNACKLLSIEQVIVENELFDGIPAPVSAEKIISVADGADAIAVTYPDYYGNLCDLQALRAYCDERDIPLLVDGAHGSMFKGTPLHASEYADMWVDGIHKNLPCPTQGAVVSCRDEKYAEKLREAVDIFRTTSPNYLLMCGIEYGVKSARNEKTEELAEKLKADTNAYKNGDWTKAVYAFGKNAFEAKKFFESKGVYPEFCDGDNVMFYFSSCTTKRELKKLRKLLKKCYKKYPFVRRDTEEELRLSIGKQIEEIPLLSSEGRICAYSCGLFPPCVPLVSVGEEITASAIEKLSAAENTYGLLSLFENESEAKYIKVFKD